MNLHRFFRRPIFQPYLTGIPLRTIERRLQFYFRIFCWSQSSVSSSNSEKSVRFLDDFGENTRLIAKRRRKTCEKNRRSQDVWDVPLSTLSSILRNKDNTRRQGVVRIVIFFDFFFWNALKVNRNQSISAATAMPLIYEPWKKLVFS